MTHNRSVAAVARQSLGPAMFHWNPDLLASPYTDSGTIPNLKFSFATARNRILTGGWAREVTARELDPILMHQDRT